MQHRTIFIFDIETIPDTDAVKNLTGTETTDVVKLRQELEQYHLEVTNGANSFPRQPFHKVVAISFVEATISYTADGEMYELKEVRTGGVEGSTEEEMIRGFFSYLERKAPRFVSYNGRGFDFPVLKYRAMKYGIAAPWFYKSGDKWNNYQQRYSLDWHCDLLEAFSDYGASAKVKMNEICAILNVPGKIGVDGSKVTKLYDAGKIREIRDYCETDVINTYILYLYYQMHTGTLSKDNFEKAIKDLKNYLNDNQLAKPHFAEFMQEWDKLQ